MYVGYSFAAIVNRKQILPGNIHNLIEVESNKIKQADIELYFDLIV